MFPKKLFNLLFAKPIIAPVQAVQYIAINNATGTPGGTRFDNEIGIPFTEQTLQVASEFIWQTFNQGKGERINYDEMTMIVESFNGIAFTLFNYTGVSSYYIQNYNSDVRVEFIGVLYHETTHVWQKYGSRNTPYGLIDGIANYIRLKAGWAPSHWQSRGSGSRWDEGNEVTAYFLEYCNWLRDGFVGDLNALMKDFYTHDYFMLLLGKRADDLWNDYKSLYGND